MFCLCHKKPVAHGFFGASHLVHGACGLLVCQSMASGVELTVASVLQLTEGLRVTLGGHMGVVGRV